MDTTDPLEILRRGEQRRSEAQLGLVTGVLSALKAVGEAEMALYAARRRYIEAFKRATQGRWTAKELRAVGLPTPKVSVLKRRMDIRPRPMPAADAADGDAQAN